MRTIKDTDKDFRCDITLPCFRDLSEYETDLVRDSKVQVLFRRGENIAKQGAFASYVIFILSGFARQYVEGTGGRDYNIRIIKPGEMVGLSVVFNRNTFDYSVVSLTEVTGFLIEKEAIAGLVRKNGTFAFQVVKKYFDQSSSLYSILGNVVHQQTNGRMASVLLSLDSDNFNGEDIFRLLTRKELADFAGISTEGAVKVLKSFEKEGLITLSEKSITLRDREKLEEIARIG